MEKHGHTSRSGDSPTYGSYRAMKSRCLYKNHKAYPRYGGRGITICQRWIKSFTTFLLDMGERPEGMTLDRIDVNGNYEPPNCRWAPKMVQQMNMIRVKNKTSKYKGVCWKKDKNLWKSYIVFKGVQTHLGYFTDAKEAALAYNKKALEVYGDYVYLNDV